MFFRFDHQKNLGSNVFLKNIDNLIRQGNLPAALKAILEAKELHPQSPYPKIYEERVRALIAAQHNQPESAASSEANPGEVTPPEGENPEDHQNTRQPMPPPKMRPEESSIEYSHQEDPKRQALMVKVASIVARAREYEARKEYALAIQEVSRAALLDPASKELQLYQQDLRARREEAAAQEADQTRSLTDASDSRINEAIAEIQRQHDEKQRDDEEQRRAAQREKVNWYVTRLTELITTERFEEAQNQLAFAQVLDPSNERLVALSQEIRARVEEHRAKRLEWARKKEEEKQRVAEALDSAISTHVHLAGELARQENFEEALRVITRAYTLNPEHPDIIACETMIIAKQDERYRTDLEKRQREEEQFRQMQSEARAIREQSEREHLLQEKREQAERRRHEDEQSILQHLARAKNFLADRMFEQAFAEIGLAFMVNPFDKDVKIMEEEIHRAHQEYTQSLPPPAGDDEESDLHHRVDEHIKEAIRFRSDKEYAKALDEIASAFLLDPLNDAIKNLEKEIHTEYLRYEEEQHARRDSEDAKGAVRERLMMAQHHFDCGKFQEALTEVAKGFKIDPENEELQALRAKIAAARLRQKEAERSRQRLSSMLTHIVKAKQHLTVDEFEQALAEVNQGLSYETTHTDLLNLKREIEQAERKWREEKERKRKTSEIQQHIRRAEHLITIRAFDEALIEISLGLTRSPGTEELKQLERKVWQLRAAGNGHNDQPAREEDPREPGPDIQSAAG
jgi:antitoxin component HigA of HigAB toxin-antitoxin module